MKFFIFKATGALLNNKTWFAIITDWLIPQEVIKEIGYCCCNTYVFNHVRVFCLNVTIKASKDGSYFFMK